MKDKAQMVNTTLIVTSITGVERTLSPSIGRDCKIGKCRKTTGHESSASASTTPSTIERTDDSSAEPSRQQHHGISHLAAGVAKGSDPATVALRAAPLPVKSLRATSAACNTKSTESDLPAAAHQEANENVSQTDVSNCRNSNKKNGSINQKHNVPVVLPLFPQSPSIASTRPDSASGTPSSSNHSHQHSDHVNISELAKVKDDWPHTLLTNSSGIEFNEAACLIIYRGPCGKAHKVPAQATHREVTTPTIPSSHQRLLFPCGCCYAGVPKGSIRKACSGIEGIVPQWRTEEPIWEDIYRSEQLNKGSISPFIESGNGLLEDRAKIVNWMSYVCSKLGFQSSVYFLSVNMFDLYIERSGRTFRSPDLPPIAASAFLQAANIIEVGSDGKLPTLREFVSAAPWLESCAQVMAIQLDMIKVILAPNVKGSETADCQQPGTLTGKTPYDFLLLYLAEMRNLPKWRQVWTWLLESGSLVETYHRCISIADLACQRGINLRARGSVIVASILLKTLSSNLEPFKSASFRSRFCTEVFKLSWENDIKPSSEIVDPLIESSFSSTFPLCGTDMGMNAPAVYAHIRKLDARQRMIEKFMRHQYRVFRGAYGSAPQSL